MRKRIRLGICALGMVFCVMSAGCGAGDEPDSPAYTIGGTTGQAEEDSAEATQSELASSSQSQSAATTSSGKYLTEDDLEAMLTEQLEEKGYTEAEETKTSRETITLGVYYNFAKTDLKRTVGNFNIAQDKYWLEIKEYESNSNLVADIMQGGGADIFALQHMPFDVFAGKGVLEDLTPYFEKSEIISKEQVLPSIWRAGSVNDKYMGVIPCFIPTACLVEKGITDNGGWTLEEYFALGEKYPNAKLEEYVQDFDYYLGQFLEPAIQSFVDWEAKSCDFESEGFKNLLVKIKENAEKKYETTGAVTIADALYSQEYLTRRVMIYCYKLRGMQEYLDIRDTFLEDYELAGLPNKEGKPMYDMWYSEMYGINAASENKEAAWSFIEYIFSEEYQSDLKGSSFTVRADLLEKLLESEINYDFPYGEISHTNQFTKEKIWGSKVEPFTEEDKENLLYIIENSYRNSLDYSSIYYIVKEEADYFFAGDKELEEVVKIIQSRANLYMEEIKLK